MSKEETQEVAAVGIRLLDDAHAVWMAAEAECGYALEAWFEASPAAQADAYYVYRAALDREEAAAHDLKRLSEITEPCAELLVAGGKETVR
jgi:hypothetical protein